MYIYLHNRSGNIEFSDCTIYNNIAWNGGAGGVFIELYDKSGSSEFSNCIIYIHNTTWNGGGLFINALECTSTSRIHFTNVSFQFNKLLDQLNIYRSVVLLLNIENVIFDQIDISNHNTTGLMCINSPIMFDGYSTFVSNSGINGGGIA